jgi:hypothetical protein
MATITSANATFVLTVPGLFSSGVAISQWATDDMFTSDAIPILEAMMGVDGHLSAGWLPHPVKFKLKLAADSVSITVFDQWAAMMNTNRDAVIGSAIITMPGNNSKYNLNNLFLETYKPIPDAKKFLEPQEFTLIVESITKGPM